VVFARRGVAATGLGEVAIEAGISRTGFYHYYRDKDALVRDLAQELLAEEEQLFEEALAMPGAVDEKIAWLADAVVERFGAWARYGRPLLEIWLQESRRLRPLLRALRKALATLIKEGQKQGDVAQDLEPQETAALLVGLIDGLMLQVFIDPAGVPPSKAMRRALARTLRRVLTERAD
jgi:AcrR family transcriptional regulator